MKIGGRTIGIAAAIVTAGVIGNFVSNMSGNADLPSDSSADTTESSYSCADLADEAVRISTDNDSAVRLLKVRALQTVQDNRSTYATPTGDREAVILVCEGGGVWSSGGHAKVRLRLTIDSDGDKFVFYRAIA